MKYFLMFANEICIIECSFLVEGTTRQFKFMGHGAMEDDELDFSNVRVVELVGSEYVDFEITATTWAGHKLDEYDAIVDIISRLSRKEEGFTLIYAHDLIKNHVQELWNKGMVLIHGREVPKCICHGYDLSPYNLSFATERFLYYDSIDCFLMLDAKTSSVIADNYFAGICVYESISAIMAGNETLVYLDTDFEESYEQIKMDIL